MINIQLNYKSSNDTYEVLYPEEISNYVLLSQTLASLFSLTTSDNLDNVIENVNNTASSALSRANSAQSTANSAYTIATNKSNIYEFNYRGTGQNQDVSLTFPSQPKIFFLLEASLYGRRVVGVGTYNCTSLTFFEDACSCTWTGNTISWNSGYNSLGNTGDWRAIAFY